jgi:beta-glucanase (GH16 family)
MRAYWILGVAISVAVAALLVFTATAPGPRLVYADEFVGELDQSTWARLTPWGTRYTRRERQYYDPANATVSGGALHLESERRSTHGYPYTSGIVTSLRRSQFSYGYFEIRAKLPKGQGIWPAFWLTDDRTLEIDGFEMLGDRPTRQYMTVHEDGKVVHQDVFDGPDFSASYHTYGVDWQPTHVRWYIDGVLRSAYERETPAAGLWICLNTAVGGRWPGLPDDTTPFPQTYDIDYVRVFDTMPTAPNQAQRAPGPRSVAGRPPTASIPAQ